MSDTKAYGALILAGGRSSRMGQDKANLEVDGQTLLNRTLNIVSDLVQEIIVMRAPDQTLPSLSSAMQEKVHFGRDSIEGQGPLQGIADGLFKFSSEINKIYLLTCDLPCLSTEWLMSLRDALTEQVDIVCTEESKISNPLLALYRKPVLEPAPQFLEAGERRPLVLWEGWKRINLTAPEAQPWICQDVNTVAEYQKIQTFLRNEND